MSLLWMVPILPLLGFSILAFWGRRLPRSVVSIVGVGSIGAAALVTNIVALAYAAGDQAVFTQQLWSWISVGDLQVDFGLHLDALSLLMILVITNIGFLIHFYSVSYMAEDASYARFLACMNLFVSAMLLLVLGDNLLLLYLGWEGVGLCSYLLIGFWYQDPKNTKAASKAFITTRIGDVALAIGLFLIFAKLGTLHIGTALERAPEQWELGSGVAVAAALLLLGGAIGKSGQMPLHVWLPDAMAGPTPVSALIHAATMVTAGVYLIARMHVIFGLAPSVQFLVACIGAITLLVAGCSALAQTDIKRVLAYSTISQVGYMFLALGAGAYPAAMFHFFTHAIFKALLFLAAGAIILAMHHEQDMFKMGGLRKQMPLVFWTFLIGACSLSAVPLVTAGFYSKDMILVAAFASPTAGILLWLAGTVGAFITGLYTFRMVFITFFGESHAHAHPVKTIFVLAPLVVLAIGASLAGFLETPVTLGGIHALSGFLSPVFDHGAEHGTAHHVSVGTEVLLQLLATAAALSGIAVAWMLYFKRDRALTGAVASPGAQALGAWWAKGWGIDAFYETVLIKPFLKVAYSVRNDGFNGLQRFTIFAVRESGTVLRATQTGKLRWYAATMALGAAVAVWIVVYA